MLVLLSWWSICGLSAQEGRLQPAAVDRQTVLLRLTVLDALSDDPLEFVAVQLSPNGAAGTTDRRGQLQLMVPMGSYMLRTSLTGYRASEDSIRLAEDLDATLRLAPVAEQLQTVTVTESTQQDALTRTVMGVERLTSEDLRSIPTVLGERDVLKSLQLTAGVTSAGEASNGVSVRGGTIDQNLLLYDGAPVFTPTHLFGLFSVFTPDAVGTADLYRGNIPARYGGPGIVGARRALPHPIDRTDRDTGWYRIRGQSLIRRDGPG